MRGDIQIIPAILATTEPEYAEKLRKIEVSGEFEGGWVQIDLMDNKFVQNTSIGPEVIAKYPTKLQLEAQLMVDYPENWIDDLIKVGIKRIIFPIEDKGGIAERISHIKNHGLQVGLSLNPQTPVAKLRPFVDKIDVILLMSVHPGFGGQEFILKTLEKVKQASRLRLEGINFLIEVDGGINEKVAADLIEAGADNLVVGSHLIDGNISENLEKFWQAIRP